MQKASSSLDTSPQQKVPYQIHKQENNSMNQHCRKSAINTIQPQQYSRIRNLGQLTFIPNMSHHLHPSSLSHQPTRNQSHLTGFPLNDKTPPSSPLTFQMPPSAFHDAPNAPIAERFVRSKRALLHRTLKFPLEPLHQPVDLQMHPGIHERVEMTAGVFERQGVGVCEVRGDLHV